MSGLRVALLGFSIECNRFAPRANEADFRHLWFEGEAMLADARAAAPRMPAELPGFVAAMDAGGPWMPVPLLLTAAGPNGPVEQAAFAAMMGKWEAGLGGAGPVDAVYCVLHGAGLTTEDDDPEGTLLAMVRRVVGRDVPVVATFDLHANITEAMVAALDAFIGYRTNPHVDMRARGAEAARMVRRVAAGLRTHIARVRLPIVSPPTALLTGPEAPVRPYGELIDLGQKRMAEPPYAGRVLNVSVMGGFAYADTTFNGLTAVVTATDAEASGGLARELAEAGWARRARFRADLTPLPEAVSMALGLNDHARPALCFADVADNPGGGGRGNTMWIIEAFHLARVRGAVVGLIHDPALAAEAHALGVGARFTARFNRDGGDRFSRPFAAPATVRSLHAGRLIGRRGIYAGTAVELGRRAALDLGGIIVAVASARVQCADPVFLESLGIDISAARCVVVKSRGHFRAGFDEFFDHARIFEVDAPGLTSPVLARFDWKHLPRPVLPLDSRDRVDAMTLDDLTTPCLVLDRPTLLRNLARMAEVAARAAVPLRPHMKTAKSIDVARLALARQPGAITVSTLAEAAYFAAHGLRDILYAVGITPQKLDAVSRLNASGADVSIITDDLDTAAAIAAHPAAPRTLIEIDTGEHRGGLAPDDDALLPLAARLGPRLLGVVTHAGHSYSGRSESDMVRIAEAERAGAVRAAERLRAAGHACPIVSIGSSPTVLHARTLAGVTEARPGVYMFGDLFQAGIGTHSREDIAVTVLASVIGRRPGMHRFLIDAGGLALSKDRSTEALPDDCGFGLVCDAAGRPRFGRAIVERAYQEHGVVACDPARPRPDPRVGERVRVAPNHVCMTAAAHDRYFVVDAGAEVVAVWPRVNGWPGDLSRPTLAA